MAYTEHVDPEATIIRLNSKITQLEQRCAELEKVLENIADENLPFWSDCHVHPCHRYARTSEDTE